MLLTTLALLPLAPQIAAVSQVRRGPAAHVVASKPITVWYVTPSGAGTGNGTSWGNAFAGLQGALAVAGSGDQIWVAEGLYTPSTSDASVSFVVPSGARLYGGFVGTETQLSQRDPALHVSHLSGDIGQDDILTNWPTGWNIQTANSGHILDVSGCAVGTVVDGFEISNGAIGPVGTGAWDPLMNGGGIYANAGNVTVRNCQFHHNLAAFGSGGCIFVFDGVAQVENCSFDFNFVHGGAGAGIAMYGTSQVQVADCSFYGNHAKSISSSGGDGDGTSIYATGTGNLVVRRSRFENNRAYSFYVSGSALGYGAGITTWVPAVVEDCEFVNNTAHLGSGFLTFSDALVVNCLFQGNTAVTLPNDPYPEGGGFGAGIVAYSYQGHEVHVVGCTFVQNHAKKFAGMETIGPGAHITVENSVFWDNHVTLSDLIGYSREQLHGNLDVSYSCIKGIFGPAAAGEDLPDPSNYPGCIEDNPLFVLPGSDYRLSALSPCIDAGDNTAIPGGILYDLDGMPRLHDDPATPDTGVGPAPVVDMGAYERQ